MGLTAILPCTIVNRLKYRESTLCTYTTDGREIQEGDILGFGDNYPAVVLYDKFEGKFNAIEFTDEKTYPVLTHELRSYTRPWEILGNIDDDFHLLQYVPDQFDYSKQMEKYYK